MLGFILIIASATVAGMIRAEGYRKTDRELDGFIALIYFIKQEISSYLTPQWSIYEKFSNLYLENNGFLPMLRRYSKSGEEKPLLKAIRECNQLSLNEEGMSALQDFADKLGYHSPDEECRMCDRALMILEDLRKRQKEETQRKVKLCTSVGAMIGIGVVLLLW